MLGYERDIEVVGEAATGREAVQLARKLAPAVVVMDIAMPVLNGLEATRQIRKNNPDTKVLILSAHSEDAYVKEATDAGTMGFLLKQASAHVVCQAIREVQTGKTFFCPLLAKRIGKCPRPAPEPSGGPLPAPRPARLSSREMEVLQLIAEGKANKQVAAELAISPKTVEKHREHLMAKLDIHDTAGLTRYAISAGVVESDVPLTII